MLSVLPPADAMIVAWQVVLLCVLLWFICNLFLRAGSQWVFPPQNLQITELRGATMADVLTYRVSVGPAVDGDVAVRRLSVYLDGAATPREVREYAADATDLGDLLVPQDALVVLSLVDVDDAGNTSEPAVLSFTAVDTVPPAQPGALGVTLVSEITNTDEPTA